MIPKNFIQDLLNRLDIVDVVERYVPLKKAGANFVACCPFHNEKSPSFTVSQTKQFYHCFGCGAHGTAIGFVMNMPAWAMWMRLRNWRAAWVWRYQMNVPPHLICIKRLHRICMR